MHPQHFWSRKTHEVADSVSHVRFIAVPQAVAAASFPLLERAVSQAQQGILLQFLALVTQCLFSFAMMMLAEEANHCLNRFSLPLHPWMHVVGLRHRRVRKLLAHFAGPTRASDP